jgi:hypothetical protein
MGFALTRFEVDRVYRQMIALADRQKSITDADLAEIVDSVKGVSTVRPSPRSRANRRATPVVPEAASPPPAELGYGHGV